jgi:hypothetical protein
MHSGGIAFRGVGTCLTLGLVSSAVVLLLLAPSAQATHSFCESGSGAGGCADPRGVAVDNANGDVYVADRGNSRVDKFDADGNFLRSWGWDVVAVGPGDHPEDKFEICVPTVGDTCKAGISGVGAGQFSAAIAIAVDNDPTSPTYRDIYVGPDEARLQRFDRDGNFLRSWGWDVVQSGPGNKSTAPEPLGFEICVPTAGDTCKAGVSGFGAGQLASVAGLAVGPGGAVHVGRRKLIEGTEFDVWVLKFEPSGALLGEVTLEPGKILQGLVVDSDGDIYASFGHGEGGIRKYPPGGGAPISHTDPGAQAPTGSGIAPLAIDQADNLYVAQFDKNFRVIAKYDVSGPAPITIARFGYGDFNFLWNSGLAVTHVPNGGVLVSSADHQIVHIPQPPPGLIIAQGTVLADPIGNAKATLNAEINAEGRSTEYHFQYVEEEKFEVEGWGGPATRETPVAQLPETRLDDMGKPFFLESAEATIGCPDPLSEAGLPEAPCLTPETKYRFRVLASNADNPPPGAIAEGEPFETQPPLRIEDTWSTAVSTDAAKLQAAIDPLGIPVTGHFEYVGEVTCLKDIEELGAEHCFDHAQSTAELDFGGGEGPQTRSAQLHSLAPATTFRYRVVADNPLIEPIEGPERAFTTFAIPPPPPNPDPCHNAQFRTGPSAFLPDCRAYELVSPLDKENGDIIVQLNGTNFPAAHNQSAAEGAKLTYSSYRSFGDAQSAPYTSQYLATRRERGEPEEGWSSHGISPPRGIPILITFQSLESEYKVFSPDLCLAWLLHDSDPPKAPGAIAGYANLYKRDNCGEGADTYEAITTAQPDVADASLYEPELQGVSLDGSHAVFRVEAELTFQAKADIVNTYDASGGGLRLACILPGGAASNSDCSAGSPGLLGNGRLHAVSHAVSEDGSRIYWSAGAQLYLRRNGFSSQAENCADPLRRCTIAIGAGQYWDAATDGSRALYTTPSPAKELREFDAAAGASGPAIAGQVEGLLGASEDAKRVYLISREARDGAAVAGKPNLYLYQAGALTFIATLSEADAAQSKTPSPANKEPARRTARVTPDGSHAVFMSTAPLTAYDNTDASSPESCGKPKGICDAEVYLYDAEAEELRCVSCNPSGARPTGRELEIETHKEGLWAAAQIPAPENLLYAERVISDDGTRLFFESFEALVVTDTNGKQDLYQWEVSGKGSCSETDPSFSPSADGCVSLISSGKSPRDSEFVDANRDGSDVYIATGSSLLAHDPGLVDIYDARIEGGFPPPPTPDPICEGEACQSPPPPPPEATPASAAGEYPGNDVEPKPKQRCAKGKRRVVRKGKARCVPRKTNRRAKRKSHRRAAARSAAR